ncbi:major facilitator superfamily domain-containing protein [Peziza echinospora]|nr:major facilitator superfamily domain-containing protein [Peziza echinospora]
MIPSTSASQSPPSPGTAQDPEIIAGNPIITDVTSTISTPSPPPSPPSKPPPTTEKTDGRVDIPEKKKEDEEAKMKTKKDKKKDGVVEIMKDPPNVLYGWRLWVTMFGLTISLFLSALETTIVATSLLRIGSAFNAYEEVGWVVVSYMLTYTGFLVIYAKMSDIFGKKNMLILGVGMFFVFSLACGASQSLIALVVCRAFQGMGASGIYSMVNVITPTIVPVRHIPLYMAIIAVVYTLSSILGPLVGGAITVQGGDAWRWVFWLNGPPGIFAITILLLALPVDYPTPVDEATSDTAGVSPATTTATTPPKPKSTLLHYLTPRLGLSNAFTKSALKRIDIVGTILLLTFSLLLVFSLQEGGGTKNPWSSPVIITTLTLSCISFLLFIIWEELVVGDLRQIHLPSSIKLHKFLPSDKCEAIFPMRLVKRRVPGSLMAAGFLAGFPFMAVVFTLPQRFQVVHLLSSAQAGIRLFPVLISSSIATGLVGLIVTKIGKGNTKYLWYLFVLGGFCQFIGVTLLGAETDREWIHIPARVFVYEGIFGLGVGLLLTSLVLEVRVEVEEADLAVAMGAITQIRVLGGCIGLALCSAVLNQHVVKELRGVLTKEELSRILESAEFMRDLDGEKFEIVRRVYADGFSLQLKVIIGFAGVAMLATLGSWKRVWKVFEGMGASESKIESETTEEEDIEVKAAVDVEEKRK